MYFRQLSKGSKIFYFIRWYQDELRRTKGKDIQHTSRGVEGGWDYYEHGNKTKFKLELIK